MLGLNKKKETFEEAKVVGAKATVAEQAADNEVKTPPEVEAMLDEFDRKYSTIIGFDLANSMAETTMLSLRLQFAIYSELAKINAKLDKGA